MRSFFIVISLLLTVCVTAEEELVVGTTGGYAPFSSLNDQGALEGFDIDVAEAIATRLNRKLKLKDMGTMPVLLIGLKQSRVDLVIWAVSITTERRKELVMIPYQGEETLSLPLLFWKKVPDNVKSIEDLLRDGKEKIVVECGSFQADFAAKFPKSQIIEVPTLTDALMTVRYGKANALLIDQALLPKLLKQYPELKMIDVPLKEEEKSFGNGICVAKNNVTLAKEVEKAVEDLKASGEIRRLELKWGLTQ